ncbi:MAG TPA: ribose-phosphate pyrophosphokinase [bacterium]|nr:ribose-phosphate pyrophosphokinase [bacterium]
MRNHKLMIFTGNANPGLAARIAESIGVELSPAEVGRFPEGEVRVQISEPVRGGDVFLIQGTSPPTNENLMELLVMIDALKRASATRITAVLPFYGYGRQDRKDRPRVPISAKLVANLIVAAGADRLLTIDLHAPQIQGFFDIPVDHLYAAPVFIRHFRHAFAGGALNNLVVVSPDVGGIKIAKHFAKHLDRPLAVVDKRRLGDRHTEVRNVIGEVSGSDILVIDDLVSTGTSLATAIRTLKEKGARRISVAVTHPVLAGDAVAALLDSPMDDIWVTDTIPLKEDALGSDRFHVVSVAEMLGGAIRRIHDNTPISILFDHQE